MKPKSPVRPVKCWANFYHSWVSTFRSLEMAKNLRAPGDRCAEVLVLPLNKASVKRYMAAMARKHSLRNHATTIYSAAHIQTAKDAFDALKALAAEGGK